jgi:hypothetical protein
MMADALPQDRPGLLEVPRAPPKQKKLGYADLQGYQELLESLVVLPESHAADMPKAPMLDAGQWLDTHFKQVWGAAVGDTHTITIHDSLSCDVLIPKSCVET